MTIRDLLVFGKQKLSETSNSAFIDTPGLDASILLSLALNLSREQIIIKDNETVTEPDIKNYYNFLLRRLKGECIAYITGKKEFRGLDFKVNNNVLVPRPDTEILLEAALEYIDSKTSEKINNLSLLDLCTGSGALAISLKHERPFLNVFASDISSEALKIANENEERLLKAKIPSINFINSDLFKNISDLFNIIVCNPPYIPSKEIAGLKPEVRNEPLLALDGGEDGLEIIRKIIPLSKKFLIKGGILLFEAIPEQMPQIKTLFEQNFFSDIKIRKDLSRQDRVISAVLNF